RRSGLARPAGNGGCDAVAGREETAGYRQRLCAQSVGDPAGRADQRRLDRREARHHGGSGFGGQSRRRPRHRPGRARHGSGRTVFASNCRIAGRQRAGRHAASRVLRRSGHDISRGGNAPANPQKVVLMLNLSNLKVDIDGSRILNGISLSVAAGELVCLVGRNGAGKTTTFRSIMGYRRAQGGDIDFEGADLTKLPTWQIAQRGIGFSPEESEVYTDLTVAENIELSTWTRPSGRPAAARV